MNTVNSIKSDYLKFARERNMKYRILKATRNSGEYVGTQIASLSAAKVVIRGDRPGRTLLWRQEGDDICAYASAEDMADEDKAIARLRPLDQTEQE